MALSHVRDLSSQVGMLFFTLSVQFVRKRCFGPLQVALVNMTMIHEQCGYRRSLALVHARHGEAVGWTSAGRGGVKAAAPDAAAFCRARHKLAPEALKGLHGQMLASPLATAAQERWRWKGFRLVAGDGAWFLLPASPEVVSAWGRPKLAEGKEAYQPQLLQVSLWDVGAVQPLAWVEAPCRGKGNGERSLIFRLLDHLGTQDVLILDRGFPSRRLIHELISRGIKFIIRLSAGGEKDWAEVSRFMAGRCNDADLAVEYLDPDCTPALSETVRFVRRRDHDGADRVLVTNLMDRTQVTSDDLFMLYRRRWGIENAFLDLKIRYEGEDFHGTTPALIRQEIDTLMLLMLLESLTEETAIRLLPKDRRPDPHDPRPFRHNRAALGDRLPELLAACLGTKVNSVLLSQVISRDPDVALHEGETEFLAGMPASFV